MKTFNITTIFILLFAISGFSQNLQFGVKAGVNFATLSGDTSGLNFITSIHGGVLVEVPISELFSVQPELLYSEQGSGGADGEKLELGYLNVPVILKYYAAEGFSVEAGPQLGILLSAKSDFDGQGKEDIKKFVKDIDFGLNFGIGYKLESGLNFGARYNIGLSNIEDEEDDGFESNDFKAFNSVFLISIGYLF